MNELQKAKERIHQLEDLILDTMLKVGPVPSKDGTNIDFLDDRVELQLQCTAGTLKPYFNQEELIERWKSEGRLL